MNPSKLNLCDLVCVIDSREQTPWNMAPMQTVCGGLHVGDYTIHGLESVISIERKSLADFIMCCGSERQRFQRELDALRGWPVNAVIVEATWGDLEMGSWRSRITSAAVRASYCAWLAQGHRMILAGDAIRAASIAQGIMFHATRYRLREVSPLLAIQPEGAKKSEKVTSARILSMPKKQATHDRSMALDDS